MQRVPLIDPARAGGRTAELFAAAAAAFGGVPNNLRTAANSPAVLESFLALFGGMAKAGIGARLHAQILLAVSEANACDYCTSLLASDLAPKAGLTAGEVVAGRRGTAPDAKTRAALAFARAVLDSKGRVADGDLAAVRAAGFTDADVVEIVGSVGLGCFTNFLNNVADTTLDVPRAEPLAA